MDSYWNPSTGWQILSTNIHELRLEKSSQLASIWFAKLPATKQNRYITYWAVIRLVHGRMGRGNHEPLPACVIGAIHQHFPALESAEGSAYTEFGFADESDTVSETDDDGE